MMWSYIIGLCIGITGLAVIDWRYKLAFWHAPKRAALTITTSMLVFILWDFFGIFLGIFHHGASQYALPFTIAPEFPLEELFFLFLLSYSALIIYTGVASWRSRT